jgi:hypothetical protein
MAAARDFILQEREMSRFDLTQITMKNNTAFFVFSQEVGFDGVSLHSRLSGSELDG